jgi:hypothetical protein
LTRRIPCVRDSGKPDPRAEPGFQLASHFLNGGTCGPSVRHGFQHQEIGLFPSLQRFVAKPRKRLPFQHLPQPAFPALPRLCPSGWLTPAQTASPLSEAHHRNRSGGRGHALAQSASPSRPQIAGFDGTIHPATRRCGLAGGGQSDSGERRVPARSPRIPLPQVAGPATTAAKGNSSREKSGLGCHFVTSKYYVALQRAAGRCNGDKAGGSPLGNRRRQVCI